MKLRKVGKSCIITIILLYLAINISKILFPTPQFHIYLGNYKENGSISIFTYENNGTEYLCTKDGNQYNVNVWFKDEKFSIVFQIDDLLVSNMRINNIEVPDNRIYYLNKLTGYSIYNDVIAVGLPLYSKAAIISAIIFWGFFCAIIWRLNNLAKESGSTIKEKLIYSFSSIRIIRIKPIIFSLGITMASVMIHYGCDISTFIGALNIQQSGLDIYQLQSSLDAYMGQSFIMWPYNYTMLMFYDMVAFLNRLLLPWFEVNKYHLIQILIFKMVGMVLINLTVLSVLSFLLDEDLIQAEKVKKVYYWSVFNPLTFWIVIIYIQLDAFPVYCITLGVLLLNDLKSNYLLSALLLSIGLCAKSQTLILIPGVFVALLLILLINQGDFINVKERVLYGIRWGVVFLIFFIMFLGAFYIKKEAFYCSISNVPQADRIWWTVLSYAPEVYLYITVAGLVFFFLLNSFELKRSIKKNKVIINVIYFSASIALMLSFGILSTPGTFVNCLAAFILLFSFSEDGFQNLIFAIGGLLMVFTELFTAAGDITQTLVFFNYHPFFTQLEQSLSGTNEGIRYGSLLFSIAHAAMLAYAVLFYKKGKSALHDKKSDV